MLYAPTWLIVSSLTILGLVSDVTWFFLASSILQWLVQFRIKSDKPSFSLYHWSGLESQKVGASLLIYCFVSVLFHLSDIKKQSPGKYLFWNFWKEGNILLSKVEVGTYWQTSLTFTGSTGTFLKFDFFFKPYLASQLRSTLCLRKFFW